MGLVLQWANLYGYVRCKVGGRSNLQSIAKNYLGAQLFKQVGRKNVRVFSSIVMWMSLCWCFVFFFEWRRWREQRNLEFWQDDFTSLSRGVCLCVMVDEHLYLLETCWRWLLFGRGIFVVSHVILKKKKKNASVWVWFPLNCHKFQFF